MAGIDKTYLNWEQYKTLKKWLTKDIRSKIKNEIGFSFDCYRSYVKNDFGKDGLKELPVWNTPSIFDIWLAKNCNLSFIQDRLKEQHGKDWIGWLDNDFSEQGFIVKVERKTLEEETIVYTFMDCGDNSVEIFDKLVIFGTDYFKKIWHSAINTVRGETYNILFKDSFSFKVTFEIFGNHYRSETTLSGTKYILINKDNSEKEVSFGYFPEYSFEKSDYFKKIFLLPEIIYPKKKSDFLKYNAEQIIMSDEDECYSVTMYKDFDKQKYKRYFMFLPDYIQKFLK